MRRERGRDLAERAGDRAEPHDRRDRRRREDVRRQRHERHPLEVQRDERRGSERRGDRDGERLGEPARHARGRAARAHSAGTSASIATTAAKLSCQPGSSAARGLRASVTAAASSSAYQREAGRPASAATRPATPMTAARWIDGPPPASGTYAATSAIASHRRAVRPSPATVADREHERREQQDVRAARRHEVGEAGGAEVLADRLGQRAVLTEHHPARERALRRRQAARQRALGAGADAVERAEQPAAAAAGGADRPRAQQRVRVAAALVRVERAERREPAGDRELDAGLRAGRPATCADARSSTRSPRRGRTQPDRRDARAERALARVLEQRGADVELAAEQRPERRPVERGEPRLRDRRAGEDRDDRAQREQRLPPSASAASAAAATTPAASEARRAGRRRAPRAGRGADGATARTAARGAAADAADAAALASGVPAARSHRDERRQRGEALVADARHLGELLDAPEAAVLLAVVEDPLRDAGADAVERVELLERRGVEVDRRRRAGRRRPARRGGRAAAAPPAPAPAAAARRPPPAPGAGRGSGGRPRASPRG